MIANMATARYNDSQLSAIDSIKTAVSVGTGSSCVRQSQPFDRAPTILNVIEVICGSRSLLRLRF